MTRILSSVPLPAALGRKVVKLYALAGDDGLLDDTNDYGILAMKDLGDLLSYASKGARFVEITVAYDPITDIRPPPKKAKGSA